MRRTILAAIVATAVLAAPASATIPNARRDAPQAQQTKALQQIGQALRGKYRKDKQGGYKYGQRRGTLKATSACYVLVAKPETVVCPAIAFKDKAGRVRTGRATATRRVTKVSPNKTRFYRGVSYSIDAQVPPGYTW